MRISRLIVPAMALTALLGSSAQALVQVVGNALAHDCFVIAKTGTDPLNGINTCTSALQNEALSPHDRAATMINRASMEMQLGRTNDALSDYNDGIAKFPAMGDAFVDRGGAYVTLHKYDLAMTDINHGLELGPTYPFVGYYNRAVAEQLTGDYANAYRDYQKVLELEPRFTVAADRLKDYSVAKAGAALAAGPTASPVSAPAAGN